MRSKTYEEQVEEKWPLADGSGSLGFSHVFSPSFVWNQINHGQDVGTSYIHALNLLAADGAAPWSDMPYDGSDYSATPSAEARAHARKYRIDFWRQVNVADPKEVKAQLGGGFPVMIGVTVDDGFMHAGPDFIWKERSGEVKGGHAMVIVGYDDDRLRSGWSTPGEVGGVITTTVGLITTSCVRSSTRGTSPRKR